MKRLLSACLAFAACGALVAVAQSIPAPDDGSDAAKAPAPASPKTSASSQHAASSTQPSPTSNAELQAAVDRLTRSNQELLDLLKQQQAVLEDIQYDRRLQNRQITLVEQRLVDTLQLNATLQAQVAQLKAEARAAVAAPKAAPPPADPSGKTNAPAEASAPPAPPASALLPAEEAGAPGTMWWHRLLALSGGDSQNSPIFHISGKQWRVLWHNEDREGAAYRNTSALFINAFPVHDTIPKKVCSQLGSGGNATEMTGTGDFYLKVEASGGRWELAVEDFR